MDWQNGSCESATRVFFDILELENQVKIEAVGYKRGSLLIVHGEEYRL